jgi:hypothetical protein
LPATLPLRISNTVNVSPTQNLAPRYPVIQYGHDLDAQNGLPAQTGFAGDSVSSGYVYRGSNIPSLYGKYVFGEITTGQIFWCDFNEMLAADAANSPSVQATIHTFDLVWDNPADAPGDVTYTTQTTGSNPNRVVLGPMWQIDRLAYLARGGTSFKLGGTAAVTGSNGRADIRLQIDEHGELYIISKSDGMIRYITEAVGKADFNNDGSVDAADFLNWQQHLGQAGALATGDADGDGTVTSADLTFIRQQWSNPTATAIPEPGSVTLLVLGMVGLARRRRAA